MVPERPFYLNMKPMPKKRPRFVKGKVHMPHDYIKWRKTATIFIRRQAQGAQPIREPFALYLLVVSKEGKMRPDLDNVFGCILDTLQDARIIANDRLYQMGGQWHHAAKDCPGKTVGLYFVVTATGGEAGAAARAVLGVA